MIHAQCSRFVDSRIDQIHREWRNSILSMILTMNCLLLLQKVRNIAGDDVLSILSLLNWILLRFCQGGVCHLITTAT